jgi:hypothetical protein
VSCRRLQPAWQQQQQNWQLPPSTLPHGAEQFGELQLRFAVQPELAAAATLAMHRSLLHQSSIQLCYHRHLDNEGWANNVAAHCCSHLGIPLSYAASHEALKVTPQAAAAAAAVAQQGGDAASKHS